MPDRKGRHVVVAAYGTAAAGDRRLDLPARLLAQVVVFVVVAALARPAGHPWWAAGLLVVALATFGAVARRDAIMRP